MNTATKLFTIVTGLICLPLMIIACVRTGTTGTWIEDVQISDGKLKPHEYKRLGIGIDLPNDLIEEKVGYDQGWQDFYRCKNLVFVIARVPIRLPDYNHADLIRGHVNVYSPEQYARWQRLSSAKWEGGELVFSNGMWRAGPEIFDTMLIRATPETKIGLTQTIYRIDRKNEDGLVLQAMITKATFTADPDKGKLYIERITNILNSVHFLKSEK
jgi:hypothetical protein